MLLFFIIKYMFYIETNRKWKTWGYVLPTSLRRISSPGILKQLNDLNTSCYFRPLKVGLRTVTRASIDKSILASTRVHF